MTLLLLRRERHLNQTLNHLVMDSTNKDEALQVVSCEKRNVLYQPFLIDFFRYFMIRLVLTRNWKPQLGRLSLLA